MKLSCTFKNVDNNKNVVIQHCFEIYCSLFDTCVIFEQWLHWYKNATSSQIYAFQFHTNVDAYNIFLWFWIFFSFFGGQLHVCLFLTVLVPVVIHSNIHYCHYHRQVLHVSASFLGCKIKRNLFMIQQHSNRLLSNI